MKYIVGISCLGWTGAFVGGIIGVGVLTEAVDIVRNGR